MGRRFVVKSVLLCLVKNFGAGVALNQWLPAAAPLVRGVAIGV